MIKNKWTLTEIIAVIDAMKDVVYEHLDDMGIYKNGFCDESYEYFVKIIERLIDIKEEGESKENHD